MKVVYTLTSELRESFKKPFGILIRGPPKETMAKIWDTLEKLKPAKLIAVGDVVSANLHEYGMNPQLSIIDFKSLRTQLTLKEEAIEKTVHVANPQAVITEEAIHAVKAALKQNEHTHIVVDGEEDLLVLIVILYAPIKSLVVYGQPHEGVVALEVTSEKKAKVKQLLKIMKPTKS